MKVESLRMLSPDARDLTNTGGGYAALRPEDVAAALAGLPDGPFLLGMSAYVKDGIAYRRLYEEVVAGMSGIPNKPAPLRGVSKTCPDCAGDKLRLYTNVERTIPVSVAVQREIVLTLKSAPGKALSPTMREAAAFIKQHGRIVRYPGGFWNSPKPEHSYTSGSFSTPTVQALVDRGKAEYTDWVDGKSGRFPVEAKLLDVELETGSGFELKPDSVVKIHRFIYLTGPCLRCHGRGAISLRPVQAIMDLVTDEIFGDNKCNGCGGTGLTHEQQQCQVCKGRQLKEQTALSRSKKTGIPHEFWGVYQGFYQKLYETFCDWNSQINSHLAKRMAG